MGIPTSLRISNQINLTLNPISMAFSILVILSIIGLGAINRQLANRMTVRLIAVIAFTDLLSHVGEYYAVSKMDFPVGTPLCTSVNGFRLFARSFYCFTNMAICFHLYRSLVQLKKTTWKSEVFIWTATAILVVAETLIYYGLGAMDGVSARARCTPGADNYTNNVVFLMFQSLTNVLTMAVGIFTVVKCHRNLNKWINAFSATMTEQGEAHDQLLRDRRKIAIRSFLYPLSTCITLPFEAIFLFITASGANFALTMAIPMALGTALAGILTFAAFAIDPSTHKAFKSAYYQLRGINPDKKDADGYYGMDNNDVAL